MGSLFARWTWDMMEFAGLKNSETIHLRRPALEGENAYIESVTPPFRIYQENISFLSFYFFLQNIPKCYKSLYTFVFGYTFSSLFTCIHTKNLWLHVMCALFWSTSKVPFQTRLFLFSLSLSTVIMPGKEVVLIVNHDSLLESFRTV